MPMINTWVVGIDIRNGAIINGPSALSSSTGDYKQYINNVKKTSSTNSKISVDYIYVWGAPGGMEDNPRNPMEAIMLNGRAVSIKEKDK